VTSLTVGVTVLTVLLRIALYFRYLPLKNVLDRDAGLVVKNVAAVPSGPMKVNGPEELLLAPSWNCTFVFAGLVAVQDRLVQCGVPPGTGLASLSEETKLPEAAYVIVVVM
jgi:hypothetical protein